MRLGLLALAFLSFLLPGCGHDTPSEPVYVGQEYGFTVDFETSDGSPALVRYRCELDGTAISPEVSFAAPQASVRASAGVSVLPSGTHTFSVRVLDQTASPTTYRLKQARLALVYTEGGSQTTPWSSSVAPNSLHTVRTGEGIPWTFLQR